MIKRAQREQEEEEVKVIEDHGVVLVVLNASVRRNGGPCSDGGGRGGKGGPTL